MMRHLRGKKETPTPARHLPWLKARADSALANLRSEMPPPSEEVFTRERGDIYRDLEVFLSSEQKTAAAGVTPVGFEVGFAGYGDDGGEPLSQPDPVEVRLPGLRFALNGRIDRIDLLPGGDYQVVDYKTGTLYWPKFQKVFRNGRLLQHTLYAIAAESLLRKKTNPKAKVTSGRYSFASAKGAGRSRTIDRPPDRDVARVVAAVLDIAAEGAFMARADAKDKKSCDFCDFLGMCGGMPAVNQAAVKLANPANTALRPYRTLQEDENA
jgi:ATP-dependent helicase/nuclease subunit B